jgi:F0F1-type ATP synthase beta subunit
MLECARKLANYFAQPFFVAEHYTHRPGTHVGLQEALATCRDILDAHQRPARGAFYFAGGIDEIRKRPR